jgi:hypothetical protein
MRKTVLILLGLAAFVVTMLLFGAAGRWYGRYAYNGGTAIPSWLIPNALIVIMFVVIAFIVRLWQRTKPD